MSSPPESLLWWIPASVAFLYFSLLQDLLVHTALSWVQLLSHLPHRSNEPQEGIPMSPPFVHP